MPIRDTQKHARFALGCYHSNSRSALLSDIWSVHSVIDFVIVCVYAIELLFNHCFDDNECTCVSVREMASAPKLPPLSFHPCPILSGGVCTNER